MAEGRNESMAEGRKESMAEGRNERQMVKGEKKRQ